MHFHTLLLYLARIKLHCTWFSLEYNILYFVAKHCDPLYCIIINCQLLFTLQPICLCTSYEFLNYLLVCALVFAPVTCLCTLVTLYFSSCALVTVQCTCYTCYCALVTVHLLLFTCYCALVTVDLLLCTCLEGQQRRDARLGKVVRVVASYGFAASIAQYAGEAPACWQSQYPPGEHMEIAQRLTSSGQTQPSYSGNI